MVRHSGFGLVRVVLGWLVGFEIYTNIIQTYISNEHFVGIHHPVQMLVGFLGLILDGKSKIGGVISVILLFKAFD